MKYETRALIIDHCKDGEQFPANRKKPFFDWSIGKLLSYGVTKAGFPFIVWETKNFGSIQVGNSRWNEEPKSRLRNDASCEYIGLGLVKFEDRMAIADAMSKQIIY